jgi:hypothetical protein
VPVGPSTGPGEDGWSSLGGEIASDPTLAAISSNYGLRQV